METYEMKNGEAINICGQLKAGTNRLFICSIEAIEEERRLHRTFETGSKIREEELRKEIVDLNHRYRIEVEVNSELKQRLENPPSPPSFSELERILHRFTQELGSMLERSKG